MLNKIRLLLPYTLLTLSSLVYSQNHHFIGATSSHFGMKGLSYHFIKEVGLGFWIELKSDKPQKTSEDLDLNQHYTRRINNKSFYYTILSGGLTFKATPRLVLYYGSGISLLKLNPEDSGINIIQSNESHSYYTDLNLSGGLGLLLFGSKAFVTIGFNGTPSDVSFGLAINLPF